MQPTFLWHRGGRLAGGSASRRGCSRAALGRALGGRGGCSCTASSASTLGGTVCGRLIGCSGSPLASGDHVAALQTAGEAVYPANDGAGPARNADVRNAAPCGLHFKLRAAHGRTLRPTSGRRMVSGRSVSVAWSNFDRFSGFRYSKRLILSSRGACRPSCPTTTLAFPGAHACSLAPKLIRQMRSAGVLNAAGRARQRCCGRGLHAAAGEVAAPPSIPPPLPALPRSTTWQPACPC